MALGVPACNFHHGDVDTNVFDTNTLLLPVWPKAIGLTDDAESFPITYTVGSYSPAGFGSEALGGDIDQTPPVTFDVANPDIE